MKWITRERVKVDRVACPWLIQKFVDPQAEFLFVPALIADTGDDTAKRFVEFFGDHPKPQHANRREDCSRLIDALATPLIAGY